MNLQFTVQSLQTGLFLASIDLSNKLAIAGDLASASDGLLGSDPLILPLPDDVPPEFPRMTLKDHQGQFQCQIGPGRCDFLFGQTPDMPEQTLDELFSSYLEYLLSIARVLVNRHKASFRRIGFVPKLLAKLQISSNEFIRDRFTRKDFFQGAHYIHVHTLHHLTLDGFEINRWVRVRSARSVGDPSDDRAITVEIDINTNPDIHYDLDADEIRLFCLRAKDLTGSTLAEYFAES
jgi:hypothetical protein